jgi:hypothetical protein
MVIYTIMCVFGVITLQFHANRCQNIVVAKSGYLGTL